MSTEQQASRLEGDSVDDILEDWKRERPDLDAETIGVFGRLPRVVAQQRAMQNENYEEFGLTLASFDVLANLRRSGAPHRKTAGELASSSMLTTGGITFRLDRMEEQGLIERVRTPSDRRVVYAQLTARGKEIIDAIIARHLETQRHMLGDMEPAEIAQLAMLLKKAGNSIAAYEKSLTLSELAV
ncbi:MarR family transcriptional regulator [Paeniglutamicibacter sulfureus]|uniref:MarR family winged helix-turn-helix transcriptional regulator n=1 Tax=Paeniglutamicibacter sulfureus TaxID=43666 RepID=UPI002665183C|nr:MarR family transcriptional regulator [Paeniglutamicibacter sulfureus]MDO2934635.1 MarR family transcriptional regulator [Paeniglutamicibacter sulfureus]